MSGKAGEAKEAALNLLNQAKQNGVTLEALNSFLSDIQDKAKEAGDRAADAQSSYDTGYGIKPDLQGIMDQINALVDNVEEAKGKAKTAWEDAKQY
jgi:hypothetical protein